ncbi:unnamed protein product [Pieris brassicae]|uniref:Uncharacterized protein n=1 Tax=Pieris brassicae TaxID=7116 RepID=A0A9P0XDL6_PIEBR|nr:unnamed protein product [Pieris brassicae]
MAFSDLCHISNAFKNVENEADLSDRIMEENSMVRDLITKILDEPGPTETSCSTQIPDKTLSSIHPSLNQYAKNDANYLSPSYSQSFQNTPYFNQNENGLYMQNGFNSFNNFPENDINFLNIEPVADDTVSPEQLNLLRLAAQEIGGAQFTNQTKYDDKFYNFFEPNQRNSLPETNMFNFPQRPSSLNLDMNYSNFDYPQRFPNKVDNTYVKDSQETTDLLSYLHQLNISLDRNREENPMNYKMPDSSINGHFEDFKLDERKPPFFNRNFPPKFNGEFYNDMTNQMPERVQNFDFNQPPPNFKPNGFQNDFMRRDMNQGPREGFNMEPRTNFENGANRDQIRQQEIARQMNLLMRSRPPPNQLNVDVSFLHENTPFNLGIGALLGPSPPVPPPVMPSPMMDLPLLAPFYAMRNMRGAVTSSSILHARLDACYEQWKQLERERKRTEAKLALAYPGRAVSSSNSIPVPRLPPCPSRVDRLTVDMLREHTKVLTLMGKMETLRASVCVAYNKKSNKHEDGKITVLKRGQGNVPDDKGLDPATYDPSTWKEDAKNLAEIAPHTEIESAMLAWRNAVAGVQAARRRELAPHRYMDGPIVALAEAVKQLCVCARRARAAMWCDLTLTVALAPHPNQQIEHSPQFSNQQSPKRIQSESPTSNSNKATSDNKEEKSSTETPKERDTEKQKQNDKERRRTQNYRHKVNQRNDFYQKNQRYDNRFMRPYHYLATGPIN